MATSFIENIIQQKIFELTRVDPRLIPGISWLIMR